MPASDTARRGAGALRRLVDRARPEPTGTIDGEQLATELRTARRRIRKLRRDLTKQQAKIESLRSQLRTGRASVTDVDPTIQLPEPVEQTIDRVLAERLTYLQRDNLTALARLVVGLEQQGRPGAIIEAGTARGGSAIVLAAAKAAERPMKVYDVFGMIPPPTDRDGEDVHQRYAKITSGQSAGVGGETYYGYRDDLYGEVTESFARLGVAVDDHRVELIRGLFADTIHLDEPVALAHLDGDWYESTMTCLERIAPLLVPGGRIVLDDYYAWSGCRTAVDEYFAGRSGFQVEYRAKVHVVKL